MLTCVLESFKTDANSHNAAHVAHALALYSSGDLEFAAGIWVSINTPLTPSLHSDWQHIGRRNFRAAVCPAGTYQVQSGSSRSCAPCPLGSFCPGGSPTARRPTDNLGGQARSCNVNSSSIDGLTTKAERASKAADCGECVTYLCKC